MKIYEVIIRLVLAIFVGGLIGYEREFNNRPAGFRTHILVCVGATLISLIELYLLQDILKFATNNPSMNNIIKIDVGRLSAQVISGIGFLGAGTILHEKGSVKGLTTAASLWVVACIGLGIGFGYYTLCILASICVFLVLVMLKRIERVFIDKTNLMKVEVQYIGRTVWRENIENFFHKEGIKIKNIEFVYDSETEGICLYTVLVPRNMDKGYIISEINGYTEVAKVHMT